LEGNFNDGKEKGEALSQFGKLKQLQIFYRKECWVRGERRGIEQISLYNLRRPKGGVSTVAIPAGWKATRTKKGKKCCVLSSEGEKRVKPADSVCNYNASQTPFHTKTLPSHAR